MNTTRLSVPGACSYLLPGPPLYASLYCQESIAIHSLTSRHHPTVAARHVVVGCTHSGPTVAALKTGTCFELTETIRGHVGVRPTVFSWATLFLPPPTIPSPSRYNDAHTRAHTGGWRSALHAG